MTSIMFQKVYIVLYTVERDIFEALTFCGMASKSISLHSARGLPKATPLIFARYSKYSRGLNFRIGLLTHKISENSKISRYTVLCSTLSMSMRTIEKNGYW